VLAVLLVAAAAFTASACLLPTPASAAVFHCESRGSYPFLDPQPCTTVTGLTSGQRLHFRYGPSLNSTVSSPGFLTNGSRIGLYCWVRGSSVHGDPFWMQAEAKHNGLWYGYYLPDWYLATGSYDQWRPLIHHCA